MSHLPSLMKRLSLAVLGACLLLLGTPLLTATPAHAGTPSGPATIRIFGSTDFPGNGYPYSYVTNGDDGTNSSVKLSADTTVPGAG